MGNLTEKQLIGSYPPRSRGRPLIYKMLVPTVLRKETGELVQTTVTSPHEFILHPRVSHTLASTQSSPVATLRERKKNRKRETLFMDEVGYAKEVFIASPAQLRGIMHLQSESSRGMDGLYYGGEPIKVAKARDISSFDSIMDIWSNTKHSTISTESTFKDALSAVRRYEDFEEQRGAEDWRSVSVEQVDAHLTAFSKSDRTKKFSRWDVARDRLHTFVFPALVGGTVFLVDAPVIGTHWDAAVVTGFVFLTSGLPVLLSGTYPLRAYSQSTVWSKDFFSKTVEKEGTLDDAVKDLPVPVKKQVLSMRKNMRLALENSLTSTVLIDTFKHLSGIYRDEIAGIENLMEKLGLEWGDYEYTPFEGIINNLLSDFIEFEKKHLVEGVEFGDWEKVELIVSKGDPEDADVKALKAKIENRQQTGERRSQAFNRLVDQHLSVISELHESHRDIYRVAAAKQNSLIG